MDADAPFPPEGLLTRTTGHIVALGLHYVGHGEDWVEMALDYDRRLIADLSSGILASGPIVSAFDTCFGAVVMLRQGLLPEATLDLRIDYLRPARAGHKVTVRCECYRLTRRIAFVRGSAHDGDPEQPIAMAAGTFMLQTKGDAR
jgi:uncharacterized protein (TIGR00369 family)